MPSSEAGDVVKHREESAMTDIDRDFGVDFQIDVPIQRTHAGSSFVNDPRLLFDFAQRENYVAVLDESWSANSVGTARRLHRRTNEI